MRKIRKTTYLTSEQAFALREHAQRTGLSESVIVSQALQWYLQSANPLDTSLVAWERERRYIEDMMRCGPVDGKRMWSREELYS